MDRLDNLPDGTAARLRAIQDEDDDEVDYSIPTTWGARNISEVLRTEIDNSSHPTSSASDSRPLTTARRFAPAFTPLLTRTDPYESRDQLRNYSFASARRDDASTSDWNSYDPRTRDRSETSRKSQRKDGQASATEERGDVNDPRNNALEGTFGATSATRVTNENSEWLDISLPEIDPRLENPDLDVDPNIRANFPPINQLGRSHAPPTAFARRNQKLVASNTGGTITTVLGDEVITYTPRPSDTRHQDLDRNNKYIGEYKGEIKKSVKRQRQRDIQERDRQMEQATADYRVLLAMSANERADLLERLRKPYEWEGAFSEDQHDESQIPEAYARDIPTDRVLTWMEDDFARVSISAPRSAVPSGSRSASYRASSSSDHGSLGNPGDVDDFAAGFSFVSLPEAAPRTEQYFRDVLHYGRRRSSNNSVPQRSSSTVSSRVASTLDRNWISNASDSLSFSSPSRGVDNLLSFDDSPELKGPLDCPIDQSVQMTPGLQRFYDTAAKFSEEHGRIVLVRLHQLVKFTPGAIAKRVFGGVIQEMQLFPVQRMATVIFLHPSEAKAFVRHVKKVHSLGLEEEIRELQIEAGWYKGLEKPHSIVPCQPNILINHIADSATRCLRLHHLSNDKTKEEVSSELGSRLGMPLLTVILCLPKIVLYRSGRGGQAVRDLRLDKDASLGSEARLGRQAIIEFVGICDAIRAKSFLIEGIIEEYEDCQPVFAADSSMSPGAEKSYCFCAGCRHQRTQKDAKRIPGREGETVGSD